VLLTSGFDRQAPSVERRLPCADNNMLGERAAVCRYKLLFARNFFRCEADVFVWILLCHTLVSVQATSPALAYRLLKAVSRKAIKDQRQRGLPWELKKPNTIYG
jgi:hypothetical protein